MKTNPTGTVFLAIALSVLTAGVVFAYGGYGMHGDDYGGHMMGYGDEGYHMMGPGYGGHMMGYGHGRYMHDDGAWGNLTEEQSARLDAARDRFFNDTRELRRSIDEKRLALESELNKAAPDTARALELQQQLSGLRDEFDQKALANRIEMQKILPDGYTAHGYGHGYCW